MATYKYNDRFHAITKTKSGRLHPSLNKIINPHGVTVHRNKHGVYCVRCDNSKYNTVSDYADIASIDAVKAAVKMKLGIDTCMWVCPFDTYMVFPQLIDVIGGSR